MLCLIWICYEALVREDLCDTLIDIFAVRFGCEKVESVVLY